MTDKVFTELYKALFSRKDPYDIELGLKSRILIASSATACNDYKNSKFRLMYVGRDLNGWGKLIGNDIEELASNVLNDEGSQEFLHNAVYDPRHYEDYNINQSRFWQLCREIMSRAGEEENWAKRIVWSNVYKVTYDGMGVSWPLMDETFSDCLEILKHEIEVFEPNHIVFVTGADYFLPKNFGDSFSGDSTVPYYPPSRVFDVISKGVYTDKNNRKIKMIAVNRPEIRIGTISEKADKIMEAFNSLTLD